MKNITLLYEKLHNWYFKNKKVIKKYDVAECNKLSKRIKKHSFHLFTLHKKKNKRGKGIIFKDILCIL